MMYADGFLSRGEAGRGERTARLVKARPASIWASSRASYARKVIKAESSGEKGWTDGSQMIKVASFIAISVSSRVNSKDNRKYQRDKHIQDVNRENIFVESLPRTDFSSHAPLAAFICYPSCS